MDADESANTSGEGRISAGLAQAAAWARGVEWDLDPSEVMTAPRPVGHQAGAGRRQTTGIRLSPRIIWIAAIVAGIAVVATVPELSTHHDARTNAPANGGRTRTSTPGSEPSGSAACKTTVHGLVSTPLGPVSLPEAPGPIISPAEALSTARSAVDHGWTAPYAPKLSSWAEVEGVLESTGWDDETVVRQPPSWVANAPWTPAWVVVVPADYSSAPFHGGYAVLVDASPRSSKTYVLPGLGEDLSWFKALTNRDPSIGGCPGGSSARLPFGVLTRDEAQFAAGKSEPLQTIVLKLTTVPALYAADPGLFGGCVGQSCTLDELVWPRIEIVHAPPGQTIPYAPWSTPPGYHAQQVKQYFTVNAVSSGESGPGPLPAAIANLKDLAPPGN